MYIRLPVSLGLALAAALHSLPAAAAAQGNEPAVLGVEIDTVETLGPGSLSGYYLAARHAGMSKDLAAAAGFYASALSKDPENTELLDNSVLMSVASGNIPKAAELARELLTDDPSDQVALMTVAIEQLRQGQYAEAIENFEKLQHLGGQLQELVGTLLTAWSMTADGRAAQAINVLDTLSGPAWFTAFTTLHAGLIADHARLFEVAEDRLRLAYERDPGAVRVADAYARFLARTGETERATAVLGAFEERIGGSDIFTKGLRQEMSAGGDVAPQIVKPLDGAAEALYGIGTAVGREGGDTFAASLLQLALFLSPQSYYPAMALGQVLESMQQYEAAIAIYRAIPDESPMKRNARVQEALNLNVLERNDEAIALLKTLVDEDPTDVSTAVALGNVYRSLEQFPEAEAIYTSSIDAFETVPETYWTLYYYRGIARERTDAWVGAEEDFRKALALEPEQPLILNYLGYSLIDRGEKLDEAIDMVRRAVAAWPDDGYIVDSLGWAYYRLDRFEDAVRELERAVSLKPGDPVINDHLGDAYWRVGRHLEAMFQWAHARDSNPPDDQLPLIEKKLVDGLTDAPKQQAADAGTEPDAAEAAAPRDAEAVDAATNPEPELPPETAPAPASPDTAQ